MNEDLPIGTPVMAASRGFAGLVMIGIVEASDQTVPGLGAGAYSVRAEDGLLIFCLPYALFDLRLAAGRPAICIHREAGNC